MFPPCYCTTESLSQGQSSRDVVTYDSQTYANPEIFQTPMSRILCVLRQAQLALESGV